MDLEKAAYVPTSSSPLARGDTFSKLVIKEEPEKSPQIKFTYFFCQSRGEAIRLLLYDKAPEFVDEVVLLPSRVNPEHFSPSNIAISQSWPMLNPYGHPSGRTRMAYAYAPSCCIRRDTVHVSQLT